MSGLVISGPLNLEFEEADEDETATTVVEGGVNGHQKGYENSSGLRNLALSKVDKTALTKNGIVKWV